MPATFVTILIEHDPATTIDPAEVIRGVDHPDASIVDLVRVDAALLTEPVNSDAIMIDDDGMRSVVVKVSPADIAEVGANMGFGVDPLTTAAHHAAYRTGYPMSDSTARILAATGGDLIVEYRTR